MVSYCVRLVEFVERIVLDLEAEAEKLRATTQHTDC